MYDPLYNENIGLGGFRCRDCKRVTRTERGMRAHIWSVHHEKVQQEFTFGEAEVIIRDAAAAIGRKPEQRDDRASDNRKCRDCVGDASNSSCSAREGGYG